MQPRRFPKTNAPHACGLTLVECLMASAITAIAVAAIAQAVGSGQMQTADSLHVQRANNLATALMDEVLCLPQPPMASSAPATEPGPI